MTEIFESSSNIVCGSGGDVTGLVVVVAYMKASGLKTRETFGQVISKIRHSLLEQENRRLHKPRRN